ncbi:hypothetical protein [Gymnodinialimonas sp.]
MEFSNLPPRAEPAVLGTAAVQRQTPDALSTPADTARPVLAAAKADETRTAPTDDFQPLDTFEVGDNDHVPVPPEPPREATVLALIASDTSDEPEPAPAPEALSASLRDIEAGPENPTVDIRR